MTVLLDTCALIFWTLDPASLTQTAREAIHQADEVAISAISVWEIGIKNRRGAIDLPLSFREYVERLKTVRGLQILPVDEQIWVANVEMDWSHRDPADRTVVATAMMHGWPLVTSDVTIRNYYPSSVW
ncbi:MAG: type II toxin-antitoxin system VapC family toxin [candidate division Zixibacteria bacterium]|nr:type II toxin-antitoxin system VapC family toxin [candidate division Zixibacteria bacterium]